MLRLLALPLIALGCGSSADLPYDGLGAPHTLAEPSILGASDGEAGAGGAAGATSGAAGAETTDDCRPHRPVLLPEVINARDLGGTPLSTGSVGCGAVFRGPPIVLTESGCAEAKSLGIRTIIDLRIESESLAKPDSACVGATGVYAPLPIPYGLSAEDYLADFNETTSIAKVFHTFGDPTRYPIYFHCTWGRDRTGVVGALLLSLLGANRHDVMSEYLLSQPNVGAYPDALNAVLDEIAARGGAEAVLRYIGISSDEIAVIRERMIVPE
jgi:protein-tyrosine phosphatase